MTLKQARAALLGRLSAVERDLRDERRWQRQERLKGTARGLRLGIKRIEQVLQAKGCF